MAWVDLGNPRPKEIVEPYVSYQWSGGKIKRLEEPSNLYHKSFSKVVLSRRSRREFGVVADNSISELLWLTCNNKEVGNNHLGFALSRRPVASAGAIHPVHILINDLGAKDWWRYDPDRHVLSEVLDLNCSLDDIRTQANDLIPVSRGSLILFVAEPGRTFSKYNDACSLVWRDAGVLLGHLALVSEFLGLNFCPLGVTGEPWVSKLDSQLRLYGVGLALLGGRAGV